MSRRPPFTRTLTMKMSHLTAVQSLPIMGSHDYRRFTISISGAGAGKATLKGSVSGDATRGSLSDILSDAGVVDPAKTNNTGFVVLTDASGTEVFNENGNGLYHFEISTKLPGGLLLDFADIDGGGPMKVVVVMSGNATIPGSPRGA